MLRSMRALAVSALVGLAACVPAAAETEPRGAVGLRTEPSAGSRGETFQTSDGWDVTVETFVLQVAVSAATHDPEYPEQVGGGDIVFRGGAREDLVVVGVRAGPAFGLVTFTWATASDGIGTLTAEIRDVPPEIVQRFLAPPLGGSLDGPTFVIGPSMIVVGRAQKGERRVGFDLALRAPIERHAAPVVVEANALALAPTRIVVEALFTNEAGELVFDDVAVADSNGDGVLTPEELDRASAKCTRCGYPSGFGTDADDRTRPSVLDMLISRTAGVIALPLAPEGRTRVDGSR